MEAVVEFVLSLVGKYPFVATVLMIMGGLRVVLKPLMVAAQAYVSYTSSPSDDAVLKKVEESKIYKSVLFVLDYVASIKLPKK